MGDSTVRTVIGVVKNFHFASMRHSIEPLIMFYNPDASSNLSVKVKGDIRKAVQLLEEEWKATYANYPFEYQFFDQEFDTLFKSDIHLN